MSSDPSFAIPVRPERRFPRRGGVEYEGETTFLLAPDNERDRGELESLVEAVLRDGPYRSRGFHELPMALWLVRDDETTDVFRVSVRERTIRLHVLPATEPEGLKQFYDRIDDRTDCAWTVECRSEDA